jgi:DNA-binding PadR family transcriptional regulator
MENRQPPALVTTDAAILGLVGFRESSGYDLVRLAEASIGYLWTPSRSQIYKVLPRLVEIGLAQQRTVLQVNRPNKVVYKITPTGRRALGAWLRQIPREPVSDPNIFPLKLFFGDLVAPDVTLRLLFAYQDFLQQRLSRFTQMQGDVDSAEHLFPELVLRHATARIRVTLAWIREVESAMKKRETRVRRSRPET